MGSGLVLEDQQSTLGRGLRWVALLAFSLWSLLTLERFLWAADEIGVLGEGLFLVRLACATTAVLALPWLGARFLATRGPVFARIVPAALSALVAFGFWLLALPIAQGDGVPDLPLEPWLIPVIFGVVGAALTLCTWGLARLRSAFWAVLLQLLLASALTAFALSFDRIHHGIASATFVFAALTFTNAFARMIEATRRPRAWTLPFIGVAVTLSLLGGWLDPVRFDRGRRTILHDQRIPLGLSVLLFGADEDVLRAVRLSLSGLTPAACTALPKVSSPRPLTSDPARRRNVLLLSIDALRRDALGARLNGKHVAPNLFAWSQQAQLMKRATTSYAATFFSVTGALTGLPASRIALLPTPPQTLFSMTESLIPRRLSVMPAAGSFFERPAFLGYALRDVTSEQPGGARDQVRTLIQFIARARHANEAFFAWAHFAEAHAPYRGHKAFYYGDSERERYLGEVAYVDAQLGRLIERLKRDGILKDTLIIVFADHGEALGERGHHGHHVFLNRWIAEVPLILHVPSGERVRTDDLAQTSDIAPTVLHFLGLTAPHVMTGRSLLEPELAPNRALYAEAFSTGMSLQEFAGQPIASEAELARRMNLVQRGFGRYPPSVSITERNERLIVNRINGLTALYDTQVDPEERHDLSLARPARLQQLLAKLEVWHREQSLAVYCASLEHFASQTSR